MKQLNDDTGLPSNTETQGSLGELADLSMPVETKAMLASIDDVLADAMQTITHTLQQSTNSIEEARQRLLADHPSLHQAYGGMEHQTSSLGKLEEHYQDDFSKDQQDYQHSVMQHHQLAQSQVSHTQQHIEQEQSNVEQALLAQQAAYESRLVPQDAPPEALETSQQASLGATHHEANNDDSTVIPPAIPSANGPA